MLSHLPRTLLPIASFLLLGGVARAQAPDHEIVFLGPADAVHDMNASAQVVGSFASGGFQRGYLFAAGAAPLPLPLPAGYTTSTALGINDRGVVVGAAALAGPPELGDPVIWLPSLGGGYSALVLPVPAAFTGGAAYDVNNHDQIVGVGFPAGGGAARSVWFNSSSGWLDLSALGGPAQPRELNDAGLVAGLDGPLFDLNTLSTVALPPFATGQTGFEAWAINEQGGLAGAGLDSTTFTRWAASWTGGAGWAAVSGVFGIGSSVAAFDINDADAVIFEGPSPCVYYPSVGALPLTDVLLPSQQNDWFFPASASGAIERNGRMASIAIHTTNGDEGAVLLSPIGAAWWDLGLGLAGAAGVPELSATGALAAGSSIQAELRGAGPGLPGALVVGFSRVTAPFAGGILVPADDRRLAFTSDASGAASFSATLPGSFSGVQLWLQAWLLDPAGAEGFAASNAVTRSPD